ncbi:MAG: ATP-binding cassette domain-containing protein [Nitrospinae bacterium]|nr:ATP-binding cassette domain-containing protein [Nitrospinota bacterium]
MSDLILKMSDVDFSYDEIKVLDGFSMEVYKGEVFVIAGSNESGKSSILKLCVGLLEPNRGEVILKGVNIYESTNVDIRGLRLDIGYLFQHPALLSNMTVYDNVALPLRYHTNLSEDDIRERVEEKLNLLGIIKESKVFPASLSYNKRRLSGIARAIIMNPELLIFDEPAAGLDPIGYRTVVDFIKRLKNDFKKTMLITVNSATGAMAFGDRVGILKNGRFVFTGSPDDLRRSEDLYVKGLFF